MFILQTTPIDIIETRKFNTNLQTGALVNFEGMVRNDEHDGKIVTALLYIADNQACQNEGELIIKETSTLFALTHAVCIQRTGQVNVGESAIWIGAWSSHRDEAFKACRHMIEEIKKRLLIWKKEMYADGTSKWIYGPQTPVII